MTSMSRRRWIHASFFYLLLAALCLPWSCCLRAVAQIAAGRVDGTVTDNSSAVVVGASISLINNGTQEVTSTRSTSTGTYVFESVQVGTYTVRVTEEGFLEFVTTECRRPCPANLDGECETENRECVATSHRKSDHTHPPGRRCIAGTDDRRGDHR